MDPVRYNITFEVFEVRSYFAFVHFHNRIK